MPDWTERLTEAERKVLARAQLVLERSAAQTNPWYRRSPARAKAIVSAYRSLAASRALVEERTKGCGSGMWVIQNRHNKLLPEWEEYAKAAEDDIRAALALKEADMLERLEEK